MTLAGDAGGWCTSYNEPISCRSQNGEPRPHGATPPANCGWHLPARRTYFQVFLAMVAAQSAVRPEGRFTSSPLQSRFDGVGAGNELQQHPYWLGKPAQLFGGEGIENLTQNRAELVG
jgi:hypothetical protein